MSTDYSEIFCTAVDEIVSKKLEGLEYDITKLCTVIDSSAKKSGKYIVSDGSVKFEAFATTGDYNNGDSVLVTIPNGNYKFQKIIIGRSVEETDMPISYILPLDSMVKMQDGIFSKENITINSTSLLANELITYEENGESKQAISTNKLICSIQSPESFMGYTKLGISADFKAWLVDLEAISGDYGLVIKIYYQGMRSQGIQGQCAETLFFGASDMLGNPYAFESFYNQEKVFDISHISSIDSIDIYFTQYGNFKNHSGELIPYKENIFNNFTEKTYSQNEYNRLLKLAEQPEALIYALGLTKESLGDETPESYALNFIAGFEESANLIDNLFVDNIKVYLGYDINTFTQDDTLILYTDDSLTYHYSNTDPKNIFIRWIHKNENNIYELWDWNDLNSDKYEIRWFRKNIGYTPPEGEEIDQYGGKDWEPISISSQENVNAVNPNNPLNCIFYPQATGDSSQTNGWQNEYIKAIGLIKTVSYNGFTNIDSVQSHTSNILIFENEEKVPADTQSFTGSSSLSIVCKDGSEGNYFIYNPSGKINNSGAGSGHARYVEALFQNKSLNNSNLKIDWIKWQIPITNTMLSYSDEYVFENDGIGNETEQIIGDIAYKEITRTATIDNNLKIYPNCTQAFAIKNQLIEYNSNNTIRCIISLNGVIYEATKTLQFGKAGSNSPNQKIMLEMTNNQNALIINDKDSSIQNTLTVQANFYDSDGKKITLDDSDKSNIIWSWYKKTEQEKDYILLPDNKTGDEIILTCNTNSIPDDNYYILQAQYNNLITYLPVPLKTVKTVNMEGAREVLYDSQGKPSYYSDAYILWYKNDNGEVIQSDGIEAIWHLRYDENLEVNGDVNNINWSLINESLPQLKDLPQKGRGYKGLSVSSTYIEGFNNKICVSCNGSTFGWSQPILIMKSQYGFPMLSNWDNNLTIDKENGTILSSMLGAGRKNSDNTFSGVLIGDITKAGNDETELGVYGLHEGEISYALKIDGTATFGKAGHGQIQINGNEGTIKSGEYLTNGTGMLIDLDDGIIDIKSNQKFFIEDPNNFNNSKNSFEVQYVIGELTFDEYKQNVNSLKASYSNIEKYILINGSYIEYSFYDYSNYKNNEIDNLRKQYSEIKEIPEEEIPEEEIPLTKEDILNSLKLIQNQKPKLYINKLSQAKVYVSPGQPDNSTYFKITGDLGNPIIDISKNKYLLQSENWNNGKQGSQLDLQYGKVNVKSEAGEVLMTSGIDNNNESSPFFNIVSYDNNSQSNKNLFYCDSNDYYLQSINYKNSIDDTPIIGRLDGVGEYPLSILVYTQEAKNYHLVGYNNNGIFIPLLKQKEDNSLIYSNLLDPDNIIEPEQINYPDSEEEYNKATNGYYIRKQLNENAAEVYTKEYYYEKIKSYNELIGLKDITLYSDWKIAYVLSDDEKDYKPLNELVSKKEKNHEFVLQPNPTNFWWQPIAISNTLYPFSANTITVTGNLWGDNNDSINRGYHLKLHLIDGTIQEFPNQNGLKIFDWYDKDYNQKIFYKEFPGFESDIIECDSTVNSIEIYVCQKIETSNIDTKDFQNSSFILTNEQGDQKVQFKQNTTFISYEADYELTDKIPSDEAYQAIGGIAGTGFKLDLKKNSITGFDLKLQGYHDSDIITLDFQAEKFPLSVGKKFFVDWSGNIVIKKNDQSFLNVTQYLLDVIPSSSKYKYEL